MVTLTTIGLGDFVPSTEGGVYFNLCYCVVGMGLLALLLETIRVVIMRTKDEIETKVFEALEDDKVGLGKPLQSSMRGDENGPVHSSSGRGGGAADTGFLVDDTGVLDDGDFVPPPEPSTLHYGDEPGDEEEFAPPPLAADGFAAGSSALQLKTASRWGNAVDRSAGGGDNGGQQQSPVVAARGSMVGASPLAGMMMQRMSSSGHLGASPSAPGGASAGTGAFPHNP